MSSSIRNNGLHMSSIMNEQGVTHDNVNFSDAGFYEINLVGSPSFAMLSISDCNVVKGFFERGRPGFEPFSLRVWTLLVKNANLALDIGAYTGIYSLLTAAVNPNCIVVAFEANPVTFGRLVTNILANQFNNNISPVNMGASSRSGHLDLYLHGGIYTMSSGESLERNSQAEAFLTKRVQTISADEIIIGWKEFYPSDLTLSLENRQVSLVKIDVEGHEKNTIAGMMKVIQRDRPKMLVEVLVPNDLVDIVAALPDYDGYWIHESGAISREHAENALNALLVPRETIDWKYILESELNIKIPN